MIEEGELFTLLIGVGTLIFIVLFYSKLKEIPNVNILIISFTSFLIGWILTILEGFLYRNIFNLFEHIFYLFASIVIVIWILKLYRREEDNP